MENIPLQPMYRLQNGRFALPVKRLHQARIMARAHFQKWVPVGADEFVHLDDRMLYECATGLWSDILSAFSEEDVGYPALLETAEMVIAFEGGESSQAPTLLQYSLTHFNTARRALSVASQRLGPNPFSALPAEAARTVSASLYCELGASGEDAAHQIDAVNALRQRSKLEGRYPIYGAELWWSWLGPGRGVIPACLPWWILRANWLHRAAPLRLLK
jgi:hypothetical protein